MSQYMLYWFFVPIRSTYTTLLATINTAFPQRRDRDTEGAMGVVQGQVGYWSRDRYSIGSLIAAAVAHVSCTDCGSCADQKEHRLRSPIHVEEANYVPPLPAATPSAGVPLFPTYIGTVLPSTEWSLEGLSQWARCARLLPHTILEIEPAEHGNDKMTQK